MTKTPNAGIASAASSTRPRLRIPELAAKADDGPIYWHIDTTCQDHVMYDIYATFDSEGDLIGLEAVDVGSC